MTSWRTARLDEVTQVLGGGTPSRQVNRYFGGGIAWATPTDVTALDQLYITNTKETVTEEGLESSSTKLMAPRAVLLTSRATIGYTAVATVPICTNQGFVNFVCGEDLLPEFLAYWLRTQKEKMLQHAGGTTFKEIARGTLRKFEISFPRLEEQRRIVDLLSRAEGIVRLRREAQEKAQAVIPTLFLDMFGDPATNPKGWKSLRLSEVTQDVRNGFNPNKDAFGDGTPFVTVNDLYGGLRIRTSSTQRVAAGADTIAKYILQRGDLCFVRSSVKRSGVGMVAVFDESAEAIFGGFVIRVRLTSVLEPLFACAMFQTPSIRKMIVESAGTGTITNINQPALMALPVVAPPIAQQRKFVDQLLAMESIQSLQALALTKATAGFNAMQSVAFSAGNPDGTLVGAA